MLGEGAEPKARQVGPQSRLAGLRHWAKDTRGQLHGGREQQRQTAFIEPLRPPIVSSQGRSSWTTGCSRSAPSSPESRWAMPQQDATSARSSTPSRQADSDAEDEDFARPQSVPREVDL
jgi:hypothetical protein